MLIALVVIALLTVLIFVNNKDTKNENPESTLKQTIPDQVKPSTPLNNNVVIEGEYPIDKFSEKTDFLGRPSVIYFAGTYCGSCQKNVPILKSIIWDEYKSSINLWLEVINNDKFDLEINQGTNPNINMSDYLPDCGYIPSFVVLDKEGNITLESCGSSKSASDIKIEIDRLLEN